MKILSHLAIELCLIISGNPYILSLSPSLSLSEATLSFSYLHNGTRPKKIVLIYQSLYGHRISINSWLTVMV